MIMAYRTMIAALLAASAAPAWAQAVAPAPNGAPPAKSTATPASDDTSEIIVSASKRSERQLDVPSAISAFRGADLVNQGYTSMKDYLALVPGVQVSDAGGAGTPVIRGLTTGTNIGAIVGVVIDGAPVGPSSSFNLGGANTTDIDPIDLERVEVLKGPQGTLYGANTLGGLISYTFARPSLTSTSVIARGELSETEHGGTNVVLHAAVSAPLISNVLGVRVSGYIDRQSGFIDNNVAGIKDENRQHNWGINGALRFEPTSDLSINLIGFHQKVDQLAQDYVVYGANHQPLNDLHYDQGFFPTYRKTTNVGIGTIDYNVGFAKLTSVTSYQKIDATILLNANNSAFAGELPLLTLFGGAAVPAGTLVAADARGPVKKFSEEVRLTSSGNGPLQYVFGGFYTHERADVWTDILGFDQNRAAIPGLTPAIGFNVLDTYDEIAGFGNVTYKFSNAFDVTGGLRVGRIRQSYEQVFAGSDSGAFNTLLFLSGFSPVPLDTGLSHGDETVKTYLATARYHFSPDGMFYLRYATGFRPGGPNFLVPGLPATFNSDSTDNFEGGVKTKFWDGRGTIDLSAYYMNWKNILLQTSSGGLNGYVNGGRARVYGFEGSVSLRPLQGLSLAGTIAYNNGKITEVNPAAALSLAVGDPLPNDPRWSGSLAADYRTPISPNMTAVAGATAKFVGARNTSPRSSLTNPDYVLPGYALFDVHVGIETGPYEIDLFIRNLTDKRAQLSGTTTDGLTEVVVQRPRTFGIALTARY